MTGEWAWDASWGLTVASVFGVIAIATSWFTMALDLPRSRRLVWLGLRLATLLVLAWCALDPRWVVREPTPGENTLVVASDRSRSMELVARGSQSAIALSEQLTASDGDWMVRQQRRFDVVQYSVGERLAVHAFDSDWPELSSTSRLHEQLAELQRRYVERRTSGILLLTDGSATDSPQLLLTSALTIPIYPVLLFSDDQRPNLTLRQVKATPTLFEASPVILTAQLDHEGLANEQVRVTVRDEAGREVVSESLPLAERGATIARLTIPYLAGDVGQFTVVARLENEASLADEQESSTRERSWEDNAQRIVVTRPTGPYRILYVAGRPSWEFKFLRRSVQDDDELSVLGLLRLADREPRFAFLEAGGRRNSFFDGFDSASDEETTEYDEPVLVRIGTEDPTELVDGFPNSAAELFEYSALVLDDIEADFFTADQQRLIREFVERRGGGLLLLGGPNAFEAGAWRDTAIAELSPVYLTNRAEVIGQREYRWVPTGEGWLEAWTRLRDSEDSETAARLALPSLLGINRVGAPKPAATIMATAGEGSPLLITQLFGRGRTAAITASDLHRWHLLADEVESPTAPSQSGTRPLGALGRQWRQLMRWLVSDLPRRVEIESIEPHPELADRRELRIDIRDADFEPDDQALVKIDVQLPDGTVHTLNGIPTETPGIFGGSVWLEAEGDYLLRVTATDSSGELIGEARSGWVWEPSREEIAGAIVDRAMWDQLAERSGGKVLSEADLENDDWLNLNRVESVVIRSRSVWHEWPVLTVIVVLLGVEWWLRRRWGAA
ncbi:MAG: hypothetical protein KDA83_14070 [Planctomycetales bacterium]|nr:hypothetical protein [Planctomycetales bacterium]